MRLIYIYVWSMEVLLRNKRSKMEGKEKVKKGRKKKKVYRDRQKIPFVINKSIYCIKSEGGNFDAG